MTISLHDHIKTIRGRFAQAMGGLFPPKHTEISDLETLKHHKDICITAFNPSAGRHGRSFPCRVYRVEDKEVTMVLEADKHMFFKLNDECFTNGWICYVERGK